MWHACGYQIIFLCASRDCSCETSQECRAAPNSLIASIMCVAIVCSGKEKLLVYQHGEDSVNEKNHKLAAIVPPGGTDSLPLLLRVPHSAVSVEHVTLPSMRVGQSSGCKRLSLRSDCDLARRVEGLLTPYKQQRVHSNLVYTPPGEEPAADSADVSEPDDDAIRAQSNAAGDVELSLCCSGNTVRLSPGAGVAASGEQASSVALAVPVVSVAPLSERGETPRDCDMADARQDDEARVKPSVISDAAEDPPVRLMDEDCEPVLAYGLRGGHAQGSPIGSATDGPGPGSPRPCAAAEAAGTIALPYVPKLAVHGIGVGTDIPDGFALDTSPVETSKEWRGAADTIEADTAQAQPCARLLAVQANGHPLLTLPSVTDTCFFRLDVRMDDAKQVMDVEAMTKVEEHSSLSQLEENHDYTLEDCIGVRA